MRSPSVASLCLIATLWAAPAPARAQTVEKDVADQLFADGKKLLARGEVKPACAKLEASLAALVQLHVRLRLADCYEKDGRVASAWAELRAAAALAGRARDKRESTARQRMAALAPRLPRLFLAMEAGAARQDLEIAIDGKAVARELFDRGVPIDPGRHQVTAGAPGFRTVAATVDAVEGKKATVEVPVLVPLPAAQPATAAPPAALARREAAVSPVASDPGRSRRRLGLIVGAVGAGVVGVGLVFGLVAHSTLDGAKDEGLCNDDLECTPAGAERVNKAQTFGNLATASVAVGLVAVATGAVLYLTAPRRRMSVGVSAPAAGSAMLTIHGSF